MMYTRHVADGYVHDLAPSCIAPGLERLEKGTRLRGQHPLTNMAMCVSQRTTPPPRGRMPDVVGRAEDGRFSRHYA